MKDSMSRNWIWVYCHPGARFPCAVFEDKYIAIEWILKNKISGCLTKYPTNCSVYEWAIQEDFFKPKFPSHFSNEFIGKFTSAYLEHLHFEFDSNGRNLVGHNSLDDYKKSEIE